MANKIVHFELGCCDREKTAKFFAELFDWKMEERGEAQPITRIETGGKLGGHIVATGHNYTLVYVHVDSLEASIEKAVGLGGQLVGGPVCFPVGRFACIASPEGNHIGLFESAPAADTIQPGGAD